MKPRVAVAAFIASALVCTGATLALYEMSLKARNKASAADPRVAPEIPLDWFAGKQPETVIQDSDDGGGLAGGPIRQIGSVDLEISVPDDEETWHRENAFMVKQLQTRQHLPPAPLGHHVESPEDVEPEAFRVVVVGDSFVWGFGQFDLDRVWHRVLASELSAKFGPGKYEFIPLANYGTSIQSYSDYLSRRVIDALDPDLVLIGFLPNDWLPDGTERRFCGDLASMPAGTTCAIGSWYTRPDYVSCLEGRSNLVGALLQRVVKPIFPRSATALTARLCEPESRVDDPLTADDRKRLNADPVNSEYWEPYTQAIDRILANVGDTPLAVLPTRTNDISASEVVYDALRERGIQVVETPHSDDVLADALAGNEPKRLWVNPADLHPNGELNKAYALDALDFFDRNYPPVARGQKSYKMSLLSNFAPSSLTYAEAADGRVTLRYEPEGALASNTAVSNDYRTVPTPRQFVPCASYGRPHARIHFNPQLLQDGIRVRITLEEASESKLVLSTVSYDSSGVEVFSRPTVISSGDAVTVTFDSSMTGVIVGSAISGCPLNSKLNLPALKLQFAKI